jgi:hypothetical protein
MPHDARKDQIAVEADQLSERLGHSIVTGHRDGGVHKAAVRDDLVGMKERGIVVVTQRQAGQFLHQLIDPWADASDRKLGVPKATH